MASIGRRRFAKAVLFSTAGAAAGWIGTVPIAGRTNPNTVVLCRSPRLQRVKNDIENPQASDFLNRAMRRLLQKERTAAAWGALFSPGDRVGIKLSCLPGMPLSTSRGLVSAIVSGLLSAGLKGENIYIWERSDRELRGAGFAIGKKPVNVFGTDHLAGGGYSDRIEISRSVGTSFSKIVESVDALISVPVLKDHDISGVSIGMKNFFGAIHNPNKFHGNRCDPYIADLCYHPLIRGKLRLIVCDASRVQVHNGPAFYPGYTWEYGGVLVSRDVVALDYTGWQIIEERRRSLKLPSLKEAGREPTHILTAGRLGLGTADSGNIDLVELG